MKNLYYSIMALLLFVIWIPIALTYIIFAVCFKFLSLAQSWCINTAIWLRGEVIRDQVVKEYDKENKTS